MIVVCEGSFSRNLRAFNVFQAGGAGMLLLAITKDLFTDNFWVPTVHVPPAEGAEVQAFLDDELRRDRPVEHRSAQPRSAAT